MKKAPKKAKVDYTKCPDCEGSLVLGMRTGTVHVHGCLSCSNAQGLHTSATEARASWKKYVDSKQKKEEKQAATARDKNFVQGACAALAAVVYHDGSSRGITEALRAVGVYSLPDFKKYDVCSYDKDLLKEALQNNKR